MRYPTFFRWIVERCSCAFDVPPHCILKALHASFPFLQGTPKRENHRRIRHLDRQTELLKHVASVPCSIRPDVLRNPSPLSNPPSIFPHEPGLTHAQPHPHPPPPPPIYAPNPHPTNSSALPIVSTLLTSPAQLTTTPPHTSPVSCIRAAHCSSSSRRQVRWRRQPGREAGCGFSWLPASVRGGFGAEWSWVG